MPVGREQPQRHRQRQPGGADRDMPTMRAGCHGGAALADPARAPLSGEARGEPAALEILGLRRGNRRLGARDPHRPGRRGDW